MKKFKIGLLGFGNMGRTHLYSIENLKYYYKDLPFEAEVAKVCTTNEKSGAVARSFGIPYSTTNEDEIIFDPDIDIIDISTPNIYHYDTLKKIISAEKAIYCEKPLCVTYSQAKQVADLANRRGVVGQIVFNNRYLAPIKRAKQLISDGKIGRILSFRCAYLHSSCCDVTRSAGWKQDKSICGGGVLFDLGSHAIDLIYYLCGDFSYVRGMSQIAYPVRRGVDGAEWHTNADEAFYITAKLKNGACGTIEASKIAIGTNDDLKLEIYGEKGAIKFDLMQPNFLYYYDGSSNRGHDHNTDLGGNAGFTAIECVGRYESPAFPICGVKAPVGWVRGHVGSYYSFLDALYYSKPTSPSLDDGAHIQWVMERAYADAAMANGENSEKEIKEKDILHSGNKSYDVHDTPQSDIAALNNALEVANRL